MSKQLPMTPWLLKPNKRTKSRNWTINFSEKREDGKWYPIEISTGTNDLAVAQGIMQVYKDKMTEAHGKGDKPLISEVLRVYEKDLRQRSEGHADFSFIGRLDKAFGHIRADSLTQAMIDDHWDTQINKRTGKRIKPTSIKREMNSLRAAYHLAVERKLVDHEDVPKTVKAKTNSRQNYMRLSTMKTCLEAAMMDSDGKPRLSRITRFVFLALETGARKEAIETLKWTDIDFDEGYVDYTFKDGRPETGKRRVKSKMTKRLRPILVQAHKERNSDFVLDSIKDIDPKWRQFKKGTEFAEFIIHDMRRTFASLRLRAGLSMEVVAKLLGDRLQTTEDHYGFIERDQVDAGALLLDDLDVAEEHRPRTGQAPLEVIESDTPEPSEDDGEMTKEEMAMMIRLLNKQLAAK